jgi:hypothetical protein
MRLSLLAGELNGMHLSSSGALLSGAASIRLLQLVASVLTLLFTTSSIVHLVERIPFHNALYFVTTTLTTARTARFAVPARPGPKAGAPQACL